VGLDSRKEYAIKDFATSFSLRDGRLIVPACSLVEKSSTWKFSGSTGLDGSLDQKVNVILSPEYSKRVGALKDLGQVLKDEQGRVVVDLFLRGTVKKPALRWDSSSMERRAKDYVAGRLKGELEKQVGKNLGVTPEARTQLEQKADSLRKEAESAGKKLLDGLMKKKK
jgi:autotransporter translocation and assembly factor TamB